MPNNTKSNVAAGKPNVVGGVYMAPITATIPTTATATLTGFECLGYVSSDGVKHSGKINGSEIKAWGGDVIFVGSEGRADEWTFKLMEVLKATVAKLVYGSANVTGDGATLTVAANSTQLEQHAFVIDMIMNTVKKRIVIPCGALKDVAEVTYKDSEPAGYDVTIVALGDSSGNTHYEYSASNSGSSS